MADKDLNQYDPIEEKFKKMPKIYDHRSKDEIFQNIMIQLDKRKESTKKPWILPMIASIAAIVLLVVMFPSLFRQEEEITLPEEDAAAEMEHSEMEIFVGETKLTKEESVQYINALIEDYVPDGQRIVTIPYTDPLAMFVVPISFITQTDEPIFEQVKQMMTNFDSSQYSLGASPLEGMLFSDAGGTELNVDIPAEKLPVSSAETDLFLQSIELFASSLGYEKVILSSDGIKPIELGNYGEISERPVKYRAYGYFLYKTSSEHQMLVPAKFIYYLAQNIPLEQLTFQEALQHMKNSALDLGYQGTIPMDIDVEVIEADGKVMIKLSNNVNELTEQTLLPMLESILLTARDFGIDYVEITGLKYEVYGPYDLTKPISTRLAVNGGGGY